MGIKQFLLVCTFIIWCLFSSWSEFPEKSLGTVVILPLIRISSLPLTISLLKQLILDQTRQNGYQAVPFSVYIHNLMFVFILEWVPWKESRYRCHFTTYTYLNYLCRFLITNNFIAEKLIFDQLFIAMQWRMQQYEHAPIFMWVTSITCTGYSHILHLFILLMCVSLLRILIT